MKLSFFLAISGAIFASTTGAFPTTGPADSLRTAADYNPNVPATVVSGSASGKEVGILDHLNGPSIDVYQHEGYEGRQESLYFNNWYCHNLNNGWGNTITSLRAPGDYDCYFWDNRDCGDIYETTTYNILGGGYISNVGPEWNDRFSSYACKYNPRP